MGLKLEQKIQALKMQINSHYGLNMELIKNMYDDRAKLKGYLRRMHKI